MYPIIVDNSELSVQSLSDILLGTDLKSNWTNEWKRFLPVNQKEFVFKDSGHAREKLVRVMKVDFSRILTRGQKKGRFS